MANITEINILHVKFVYNFTMLTMVEKSLAACFSVIKSNLKLLQEQQTILFE